MGVSVEIGGWLTLGECSVELGLGRGLLSPHSPRRDIRPKIVLAADWTTGPPPQHGELPTVNEGIGDGPLKQALWRTSERLVRDQKGIESFQGAEEAGDIGGPFLRRMGFPNMVPMRKVPSPVKQITTVSQAFAGRPGSVSEAKVGEPCRRVSKRLAGPIRDGGESMA